jgi:hypothetical protein
MTNLYNSDTQLVPFLRELADSIEYKKLQQDQLKYIGEFYMSYKFREKQNRKKDEDEEEEEEEEDIVKFLTLGWWMYTQMRENKSIIGSEEPNLIQENK